MKQNGARSNPRAAVELSRLGTLHDELLRKALVDPREFRPAPAKVSPVLETVTMVLEPAGEPMRAREIHAAAERLAGEPLLWKSVKAALSADVTGEHPRFRRVRRGVYQTAESVSARRAPLLSSPQCQRKRVSSSPHPAMGVQQAFLGVALATQGLPI